MSSVSIQGCSKRHNQQLHTKQGKAMRHHVHGLFAFMKGEVKMIAPSKLQPRGASKHVAAVLEDLGIFKKIERLEEAHIHVKNEPWMDLVIEKHCNELSFAHYREQNGDLINDGEMVFTVDRAGILCLRETVAGGPFGPVNGGPDKDFARMFARNLVEQGFGKGKVVWMSPQDDNPSGGSGTHGDNIGTEKEEAPSVSFEQDPDVAYTFSVDPKVVFSRHYLEKIEIVPDLEKILKEKVIYVTSEKDLTDACWLLKDGNIPEQMLAAVESKKAKDEVIEKHSSKRLWDMISGEGMDLEFVFAVSSGYEPLHGITALICTTENNQIVAFNGDVLAWMYAAIPDVRLVYYGKPAEFGVLTTHQGHVGLLKPLKPGVLNDLAHMKVVKRVQAVKKDKVSCQAECGGIQGNPREEPPDKETGNCQESENQSQVPVFLTGFERLTWYCDMKKDQQKDRMTAVMEKTESMVTLMDGTVLRKTPEGQPKVSDLIHVGDIVRVTGQARHPGDALPEYQPPKTDVYRVEGMYHSKSPEEDKYSLTDGECFTLHLALLEDINKNGKLPRGYIGYSVDELVAVEGRLLKLFAANMDEVFLLEKAKTGLEDIDQALAEREWTLKDLLSILDDNVFDGKKISKKESSALIRNIAKARGIKGWEKLIFKNLINGILIAQFGSWYDEPKDELHVPEIDNLELWNVQATQEQYILWDETCQKAEKWFLNAEDNKFYVERFHGDSKTHMKAAQDRYARALSRLQRVKREATLNHRKLVEKAINANVFLSLEVLQSTLKSPYLSSSELKSPLIEAEIARREAKAQALQANLPENKEIQTPEELPLTQPVQILAELPEEVPNSFKEEVRIIHEFPDEALLSEVKTPEIWFSLDSRIQDISLAHDMIEEGIQYLGERNKPVLEMFRRKLIGAPPESIFSKTVAENIAKIENQAVRFHENCHARFTQAKDDLALQVTEEIQRIFPGDHVESLVNCVLGLMFAPPVQEMVETDGEKITFTMSVRDVIGIVTGKHRAMLESQKPDDNSTVASQEITTPDYRFKPGDRVRISPKLVHIAGQEGTVTSKDGSDYVVKLDSGPLEDPFEGIEYDPSVPGDYLMLIGQNPWSGESQAVQVNEDNPAMDYMVGDRVSVVSGQYAGRHGEVILVKESPVSDATKPKAYLYTLRTDNGLSVDLFSWSLVRETSRPAEVIMDIETQKGFVEPEILYCGLLDLSRKVNQYRMKADMEPDTQKKAQIEQMIQVVTVRGKEAKTLFVQWAAKHPIVAKRLIEKHKEAGAKPIGTESVLQPAQPSEQQREPESPKPSRDMPSAQRTFTRSGMTRRNQVHRR